MLTSLSPQVMFLGVQRPAGEFAAVEERRRNRSQPGQRHVLVGELLVGGLESAFRQYFPPLKYRSTENRNMRGFVKSLLGDEGLVNLAEGGEGEMARLDDALKALDTHEAEITHCLWEDFQLLLGRALGEAVYEKGIGFVMANEDPESLSEKMAPHFDQAGKTLDQICDEGSAIHPRGNVGDTREAFLEHLNKVAREGGDYRQTSTTAESVSGNGETPSMSVRETWAGVAMDVDGSDTMSRHTGVSQVGVAGGRDRGEFDAAAVHGGSAGSGGGGREQIGRLENQIADVERQLAELKMSREESAPTQAAASPPSGSGSSSVTPGDVPTAWGSRWQSALQVSESVEARMAAKARKVPSDSYLRKGPLSPEQEQEVDNAFDGGPGGEILVHAFNADVTRRDLSCLRPLTWLNDEVVNMYLSLLGTRDAELCKKDPQRRPSHFFSSFFLTKLRGNGNYNYAGVRRWTRKIKVFAMDKIFFPVNVSNAHWCMAVAYIQEKRINYYDSMAGAGRSVTKAILMWLEDEDMDKNKDKATFDPDEWTTVGTNAATTPQQGNGSDCGAFAVAFASYLADDLPFDFTQRDITQMRRRMMWSLLHQLLT